MSAIGMLRFLDIYSRAQAATNTATLALLLALTGTFVYFLFSDSFISVRLILGIIFLFLTAPVSGHLILRASYRSGVKMTQRTAEDELKDYFDNGDSPPSL